MFAGTQEARRHQRDANESDQSSHIISLPAGAGVWPPCHGARLTARVHAREAAAARRQSQVRERPVKKEMTARIRNTKNRIFAMPAAPAAMPPKPNTAAISAITKKTTA